VGGARKIILDLCGGTGAWSQPYRDAGYDVQLVTLPTTDIHAFLKQGQRVGAHGILAAPPCTEFAASGARWWKTKDPKLLAVGLQTVVACLLIIDREKPKWWALENPAGRLPKFIGDPVMYFNPCATTATPGRSTRASGGALTRRSRLRSSQLASRQFTGPGAKVKSGAH
jgi:hypothetical protein